MTPSNIPFDGDARKYLLDYCRASHALQMRHLAHIRRPLTEEHYQSEADKWAACMKWLEEQDAR